MDATCDEEGFFADYQESFKFITAQNLYVLKNLPREKVQKIFVEGFGL